MKLVECIPNFSEGRNQSVLDAIAQSVRSVSGVQLLAVDAGAATHRTVFTFVGETDAILEAAFAAIRTASELINMEFHKGEHSRMGATDVCPFVPLEGATMQDCIDLANKLGKRVGKELKIPVYLYEEAASCEERRNLAKVRAGEYEGLATRLKLPEWKPDYGTTRFNAKSGAIAIGARKFLVAYNINLNTRDKRLATDIALEIREAGRNKRGPDGKFIRDPKGVPIKKPGLFKHVKAVGWYIDEYERAQISINFTDLKASPIHAVFNAACQEAEKRGLRVTGSELVGLLPLSCILEAGRHYLHRQGRSTGVPEKELIQCAIRSLGLDELGPFDPLQRIIEYRVKSASEERLRQLSVDDFLNDLSSEGATPGGGSVAALVGSLGAALACMVANLTHNPMKKSLPLAELDALAVEALGLKESLLRAVDADAAAFDAVMVAMRLPFKSPEQQEVKKTALREATRAATLIPLGVVEKCPQIVRLASEAARIGNSASLSDAGVSALCAATAAGGAYYNVLINLATLQHPDDAAFVTETTQKAKSALSKAMKASLEVSSSIQKRLENEL